MIAVAVLGTGSIGTRHLAVLRSVGANPIAVSLRDERRCQLASEGYSCAATLEAAQDAGAVAAVIATRTGRHCSDVANAFGLGFPVLCEKPLAGTYEEAQRLQQLLPDPDRWLFVAYCLRFDIGLQAFRERLAEIGEVHSVRIECRSFLPDWRLGRDYRTTYSAQFGEGGVIADLSHEIDYAVWLFGAVEWISGDTGGPGRLGIESEEMAEASWTSVTGVRVSVELDYLSRCPVRFVRASGSQGELTYDLINGSLVWMRPRHQPTAITFDRRIDAMYEAQASAFLHAARGGPTGVLASLKEALSVLKVCDAWRQSGSSGNREKV